MMEQLLFDVHQRIDFATMISWLSRLDDPSFSGTPS